MGTILTRDTGSWSNAATWPRTLKAPCVLHQTVTLPSAFQRPVALCGSM